MGFYVLRCIKPVAGKLTLLAWRVPMKKLPIKMRIKNILGLYFVIGILFTGDTYSGEKEQLELAFKLVEQTHMSKMYIELAEVFMEPYFERYEPAPEDQTVINPLKKKFKEEVGLGEEELKWMLAGIYVRYFSENELREILDFFSSPTGTAWLDKRLDIQTEGEQIGLEWGKLLTQRVMKKFKAEKDEKQ